MLIEGVHVYRKRVTACCIWFACTLRLCGCDRTVPTAESYKIERRLDDVSELLYRYQMETPDDEHGPRAEPGTGWRADTQACVP